MPRHVQGPHTEDRLQRFSQKFHELEPEKKELAVNQLINDLIPKMIAGSTHEQRERIILRLTEISGNNVNPIEQLEYQYHHGDQEAKTQLLKEIKQFRASAKQAPTAPLVELPVNEEHLRGLEASIATSAQTYSTLHNELVELDAQARRQLPLVKEKKDNAIPLTEEMIKTGYTNKYNTSIEFLEETKKNKELIAQHKEKLSKFIATIRGLIQTKQEQLMTLSQENALEKNNFDNRMNATRTYRNVDALYPSIKGPNAKKGEEQSIAENEFTQFFLQIDQKLQEVDRYLRYDQRKILSKMEYQRHTAKLPVAQEKWHSNKTAKIETSYPPIQVGLQDRFDELEAFKPLIDGFENNIEKYWKTKQTEIETLEKNLISKYADLNTSVDELMPYLNKDQVPEIKTLMLDSKDKYEIQ